ncbi:RagB/SusD family nutrient uptake outer membrane protein [Sinomicrobium kalidii]|uniref:RagB/SusD family nutrient uptake outer membrane protein n=1 Tax=Sinomicrobium kalidii TaxID=2900738 RepID=UPI001E2E2EE9|nr:RagB/SusD family nutrient uptake outer membrane protein [Sinomicrobium kalidii]UGU15933.1 RagB/SusD family nutrient uptake outer membrane protein [Sinomicrobium kalidii]
MKLKIKNIFLVVILIITTAGCEEALVENPKSIISPDNFFTTEDQCIQATNGSYAGLPRIFGQQDLWSLTFAGTDLFMFNGGSQTIHAVQNYNFSPANAQNSYDTWNRCYDAIKDVNLVIARVSEAPIDDSLKERLIGENKFLRAVYYYILSNTFGEVPLWTEELDVDVVSELPRAPLAEVREQIITDLNDASDHLPWPSEYGAEETGRATKGAALGLLAKVYLFNEDYANAKRTAEAVTASNEYALLDDYSELFDMDNTNNKESVFEIQFKRDASTNTNYIINYFYTWFLPVPDSGGGTYGGVDFGNSNLISYHEFYPSARLISLYAEDDTRKDEVLAYEYEGQPFTSLPEADRPWFGPKFWDLTASQRASEKNLYFMRYADVLLILAEAENELGNTANAISQLNKIRFRATGKNDVDISMAQEEIRRFIMDERARELVGEFNRKWDLARWGNLVDAVQSLPPDDNVEGAANVRDYHEVFPIPFDEIVQNPNLEQNPGY